jgi:hypothetical protein
MPIILLVSAAIVVASLLMQFVFIFRNWRKIQTGYKIAAVVLLTFIVGGPTALFIHGRIEKNRRQAEMQEYEDQAQAYSEGRPSMFDPPSSQPGK